MAVTLLDAFAVKVFTVVPFFLIVNVASLTVGIVAEIAATPFVTVALVPLKLTPVKVPAFLVNPQPETVLSVTAAGIVAVIAATPLFTVAEVPLNVTPVRVPVLEVLLFQLVISAAVILAATDAANTGSFSLKAVSGVIVFPPKVIVPFCIFASVIP